MRTPKDEREFSVGGYTYNPDGTRTERIEIYTSDYSMMLKFDRYCKENPDDWKIVKTERCEGDIVSRKYSFPLKCLSFRKAPPKGRELSEEEKQARIEQLRRLRKTEK